MRSKFIFLLKYYFFWIVAAVVAKVIFLLYEGGGGMVFSDYCQVFWRGIRMDLSLGGYIMLLASVFMALTPFAGERWIKGIYSVYTFILLVLFWLIVIGDLEIYKSWGYHVDATPLLFIKTPGEALASLSNGLLTGLLVLLVVLIVSCFYIYKRCISRPFHFRKGHWLQAVLFLLLGGLMIIPVRGGFNVAPMNSSFVFFHKTNMHANQAAINPVWNFIYEVTHAGRLKNKYSYMPDEQAHRLFDSLYVGGKDYPRLLKEERPNIVVLLLESFTASAIEALGGEAGVTPNLNQIAREGILFSNIYATGNRSDRGMVGVISAFPAYPGYSLLKYPQKITEHPRFPKDLEAQGYHTCFYYAGDLNFGGFRSYVTMSFQDVVTEKDFSGEAVEKRFKWGIHDEYMFDRLFEDMNKATRPFMYMAFNMSSHEPFEVPMEKHIQGESTEKKFLNAIYYSDRCIGHFIRKCKESGLWDNTLFIFVADHSTIKIGNPRAYEPEAFHIPMIFAGGVLNVQDNIVRTIGSQTDMVATLFSQLNLDHSAYKFSKNLLAEDIVPFAYYAYSGAGGFISREGVSVYNLQNNHFIQGDSLRWNDEHLKAYLQVVDEDINRNRSGY